MDSNQIDFICHYRGGMNFKLAAKRASCTTTQIRAWFINDPEFAVAFKEVQDERIFEAKRTLVESLPAVVDALISNAKGTKPLAISAARLVFQAAGVQLPDLGRRRPERVERPEVESVVDLPIAIEDEPDDLHELQDIAKGIS